MAVTEFLRKSAARRVLAALLTIAPAWALAGETLSWQACVEIAARNNPDLIAAAYNVQALEYQEGSAASAFYPQLSAGLGYSRGNRIVESATGTELLAGTSEVDSSYSASLAATQNLFAGYRNIGNLRQAQANTLASAAALKAVKARVSFALKSAFEGLLYAKAYQRLTDEIILRREENLRLVELRFESGRENKGSVLLSRAYLEQARYDDLQARNAERVARAELAQAMGLRASADFDIEGAIPTQEPLPAAPIDFRELALATPDFRQAQSREEAAEAGVTVSRAGFYPSVDLTGTTGRTDSGFFPDRPERWSVGVSVAIPLFTGGRNYYGSQAAVAALAAAASNRESVADQVVSRLEEAHAVYVEAVARLEVDARFREAAVLRAEIARNRYNTGLLSFEDWDVIENDLISRQRIYLQSLRDRVVAEAAWEQAQGQGAIP